MKTRREFLGSMLAAGAMPGFVGRTLAEVSGREGDTILVVLQLAGGNDGLNTVVPHADDAYHRLRPRLAKKEADLIRLADGVGLNGSMPFLGGMFDRGSLAVVQGVGYPNANRSHFVSTSIWETADPDVRSGTGWLGRYFDKAGAGNPTVGVSLGKGHPESFGALLNPGISLSSPELYRWIHSGGEREQAEEFFARLNGPEMAVDGASIGDELMGAQGGRKGEGNLDFLERVAMDARISSSKVLELAGKTKTSVRYSGTPVARSLSLVARMIAGGLPTRVFYVSHGGFDTHQGQANSHDRLLGQLDEALKAFFDDLEEQGNASRVVVMTFSEFGRRVEENASAGTDHGKASCLFVAGDPVKGGLYGKYPSLTDLDQGDLRHNVDFRAVYAGVLEGWLGADALPVLGGDFGKLALL